MIISKSDSRISASETMKEIVRINTLRQYIQRRYLLHDCSNKGLLGESGMPPFQWKVNGNQPE